MTCLWEAVATLALRPDDASAWVFVTGELKRFATAMPSTVAFAQDVADHVGTRATEQSQLLLSRIANFDDSPMLHRTGVDDPTALLGGTVAPEVVAKANVQLEAYLRRALRNQAETLRRKARVQARTQEKLRQKLEDEQERVNQEAQNEQAVALLADWVDRRPHWFAHLTMDVPETFGELVALGLDQASMAQVIDRHLAAESSPPGDGSLDAAATFELRKRLSNRLYQRHRRLRAALLEVMASEAGKGRLDPVSVELVHGVLTGVLRRRRAP